MPLIKLDHCLAKIQSGHFVLLPDLPGRAAGLAGPTRNPGHGRRPPIAVSQCRHVHLPLLPAWGHLPVAPSARTGTAPQSAGWSSNSRCAADQINLAADPCFIMNVGHRNSKMIVKSLDIFGHNTSGMFADWFLGWFGLIGAGLL